MRLIQRFFSGQVGFHRRDAFLVMVAHLAKEIDAKTMAYRDFADAGMQKRGFLSVGGFGEQND